MDSYYTRVLSLGYYDSAVPEIVVATVGKWELRLEHEIGHSEGKKHVPIHALPDLTPTNPHPSDNPGAGYFQILGESRKYYIWKDLLSV